jgi:hypothetical protein
LEYIGDIRKAIVTVIDIVTKVIAWDRIVTAIPLEDLRVTVLDININHVIRGDGMSNGSR